jgi:hypothetical protein
MIRSAEKEIESDGELFFSIFTMVAPRSCMDMLPGTDREFSHRKKT